MKDLGVQPSWRSRGSQPVYVWGVRCEGATDQRIGPASLLTRSLNTLITLSSFLALAVGPTIHHERRIQLQKQQEYRIRDRPPFLSHIIDTILSFLSYPGLVICSCVCKEWRKKARPRMFQHVAVFENKSRDSNIVRSRDVDWPDLSSLLVQDSPTNMSAFSTVLGAPIVDSYYEDSRPGKRWAQLYAGRRCFTGCSAQTTPKGAMAGSGGLISSVGA